MDDLESLKGDLEIERRSLAMLPPSAYVTKGKMIEEKTRLYRAPI